MGHHGGMARPESWPHSPSWIFHRWVAQREHWRQKHAPQGRRFVVKSDGMHHLYLVLGGLEEAVSIVDLEFLVAAEKRQKEFQGVVWDADVRELLRAAEEGGEEAAWAVQVDPSWLSDAATKVQEEQPHSEAQFWIEMATDGCPDNPLVRSEELQGLLKTIMGARRIGEHLRDALIMELLEDGYPKSRIAKTLGWSYGRLSKRVLDLEMNQMVAEARVRQGEVPGVLSLSR